jgi:hypothetical protein
MLASFWSLIIALEANIWHRPLVEEKSITVKKNTFNLATKLLEDFIKISDRLEKDFAAKVVYYEDALTWPVDHLWRPDLSKFSIVNAKDRITIVNLDEVNNWLEEIQFNRILERGPDGKATDYHIFDK